MDLADTTSSGLSELLDITSHIQSLRQLESSSDRFNGRFLAPSVVKNALELAVQYLSEHYPSTVTTGHTVQPAVSLPLSPHASISNSLVEVRHNVRVNRRTTLSTLYIYQPGTSIEYPVTSSKEYVGHLFSVPKTSQWYNPIQDVLYSRGPPSGSSHAGNDVYCEILVTADGEKVPCRVSHWTCGFARIFYDNSEIIQL